jgi:predicted Zn-dependent protease
MHLRLLPGKATREEMIAAVKRGVLVTRFHYTNVVEPMRVVITGMTRDGTFLIENGKVTKPVRNFRFTQSVLDALSCVSLIGKDAVLVGEETMYGPRFAAGIVAPALKIDKFNFSGVTKF